MQSGASANTMRLSDYFTLLRRHWVAVFLCLALGVGGALEKMAEHPGATVISYEPSLTLALDEECRTQCRLSIETRTNAYQVRMREYPEEQLSVYVTARQYGSLSPDVTFIQAMERLTGICKSLVDDYVIEQVLKPLARTIALK